MEMPPTLSKRDGVQSMINFEEEFDMQKVVGKTVEVQQLIADLGPVERLECLTLNMLLVYLSVDGDRENLRKLFDQAYKRADLQYDTFVAAKDWLRDNPMPMQ